VLTLSASPSQFSSVPPSPFVVGLAMGPSDSDAPSSQFLRICPPLLLHRARLSRPLPCLYSLSQPLFLSQPSWLFSRGFPVCTLMLWLLPFRLAVPASCLFSPGLFPQMDIERSDNGPFTSFSVIIGGYGCPPLLRPRSTTLFRCPVGKRLFLFPYWTHALCRLHAGVFPLSPPGFPIAPFALP